MPQYVCYQIFAKENEDGDILRCLCFCESEAEKDEWMKMMIDIVTHPDFYGNTYTISEIYKKKDRCYVMDSQGNINSELVCIPTDNIKYGK